MCIFTGNVDTVNNTKIFCRDDNGTHMLVYQMSAEIPVEMAMVLPVPAADVEDSISFINLENYEDFFKDMEDLFPVLSDTKGCACAGSCGLLKVHDVGNFIASYLPRLKDIGRLDKRFQLPYHCWSHLPKYDNFGYAVFKLKPGRSKRQAMAYCFKSTHPEFLFYPTVHIHDGFIDEIAEYDHTLYFQAGGGFNTMDYWEKSSVMPSKGMKIDLCQGLVNSDIPIEKLEVVGKLKNCDYMIFNENGKSQIKHNQIR